MTKESDQHLMKPFVYLSYIFLLIFMTTGCSSYREVEGSQKGLQMRVMLGEGASVPAELAVEMQWPEGDGKSATPEEVELGRLLFFDPLLSGNNEVSCATCHHPDLGFADGLQRSVGLSGVSLRRNAPSLWNASTQTHFTWDGRANSLQNQMLGGPLFDPDEMAASPNELLNELRSNEEYARRFDAVYGQVSLDHLADAIAAFQRTLISRNSPFDAYAQGQFYALTGAQRRGFDLFASKKANCIQCHQLPTFASNEFKVTGVSNGTHAFDGGRGEVTGNAEEQAAFSVPSLRNVVLSAPYMHSGVQADLGAVLAFYLNGGGNNGSIPPERLDDDLQRFNLTSRELKDIEAFLLALTDESALPDIPQTLPSELSPVVARHNPARERVHAFSALPLGTPRIHHVQVGQSIQDTIDIAQPNDQIIIAPGQYAEALAVDVANLTIEATDVQLTGNGVLLTGLTVYNNHLTVIGLEMSDFQHYTIDVQQANNLRLQNVILNGVTISSDFAIK